MLPRLVLLLLLVIAGSPALADASGNWLGTLTGTASLCDPPIPLGATVDLRLTQTESTIRGTFEILRYVLDCTVSEEPEGVRGNVRGTADGDSFQLTLDLGPGVTATLAGSVAGDLMTITLTAGDVAGNGILSRIGTLPADFVGTWSGATSSVATFCTPKEPSTGPMTIVLDQLGAELTGTATITHDLRDCVRVEPRQFVIRVDTSADGHHFRQEFTIDDGEPLPGVLFGSVNGGTLLVWYVVGDASGNATLTGGGPGSRVPTIVSFVAQPAAITPPHVATLLWTTRDADVVTIDQGVGEQPTSGGINVQPETTTTYTLTATGPGGTATARTTVVVNDTTNPPPTSTRRRSVRH